jgi:UDP-3-O-[3-hydroxymyristoyl] glucosamine N-acyltransferase
MFKHSQLVEYFEECGIEFSHTGQSVSFDSFSQLDNVIESSVTWSRQCIDERLLSDMAIFILPLSCDFTKVRAGAGSYFFVEVPRVVFAKILKRFFQQEISIINDGNFSDKNITVGSGSIIYPDVAIGSGAIIHNNVVIYPGVTIGLNVEIESNCIIGSKGFGYVKDTDEYMHFPHLGGVVISDNVEIGANTCVDRGTMGNTFIGEGTKISNLCQIAHNTNIGRNCLIAGKAQIGGGSVVGDGAYIGPSAIISNKIKIGKNCDVKIGSVVISNIKDGLSVSGNFAMEHKKNIRNQARLKFK